MLRCVVTLMIGCAIAANADPAPATQTAPDATIELKLEDPLTAESRCYVDLDTAAVLPRGEMIADRTELRRWIEQHGVDLMCESREPADGLIAYGLCLRDATADVDHPPDFVTLRRMFEKADAPPFDFVSPTPLPKTYLFRTSDGAMGVLEVSEFLENPSGMRIRYRLVHEPQKAPLVRNPVAGRINQFAMRVQVQRLRLNKLRETYGENHELVKQAAHDLDLYIDLFKVVQNEPDQALQSLKIARISNEYTMRSYAEKLGPQAGQLMLLKQRQSQLDSQIGDREAQLRRAKVPTTLPALPPLVSPATQPFAKDFHL